MENLLYSVSRMPGDFHLALNLDDDLNIEARWDFAIDDEIYTSMDRRTKWEHGCRELARRAVWLSLEKNRRRTGGTSMCLDNGIDKDATTSLYNKCDARRQGILRKIMLGGVWTNHRRHLADSTV